MNRKPTRTIIKRARNHRRTMPVAEVILWAHLRNRQLSGLRFRRQMPIGPYLVDFACHSHSLVIEIDGPSHQEAGAAARDRLREDYIRSEGWTVLRFTNEDVISGLNDVCATIVRVAGVPVF